MSGLPFNHILITGGAGFIGSHICEKLVFGHGIRVTALDNFDAFYDRHIKLRNIEDLLKSPLFRLQEGDIRDREMLENTLQEPIDAIIHIAAKAGVIPSLKDPLLYEDVNIKGTLNLLEFARQHGISRFIFASSSSVYGVNRNVPWSERDFVLQPISPYASSKIAGELTGHTYSHLYDIRFLALRLFTVYGPRQRPDLAIHKFAKKIMSGEPIQLYGDGSTKRDYTYVSDIVDGFISALSYSRSNYEVINLGNFNPVALSELVSTIEDVFGRKAVIERLPEQPGDVPITFADIAKGKGLLGYMPKVNLKEGITLFRDWYFKMYQ